MDERISLYDRHIAQMAREDTRAQQLMHLPGIGQTTATALLAMIGKAPTCNLSALSGRGTQTHSIVRELIP